MDRGTVTGINTFLEAYHGDKNNPKTSTQYRMNIRKILDQKD